VQYYTVKLTNARIVAMKTVMANIRHPEDQKLAIYEELALSYDRADWTWTNGGITTAEMGGNAPK
jgi:type VI secretion system secreted protein Hcp